MIRESPCIRVRGDEAVQGACQVAEESPLSIFVNGRHYATAMISPALEREFVIGHLFSERIIRGLDEIESLEIDRGVARAIVSDPIRAALPKRPIVSGCGGVASFLDGSKLPVISSDLRFTRGEMEGGMRAVMQSEVHRATGGVHSVGLFLKGGPVCQVEDIGRHSALDKALGICLLKGIDPGSAFMACTGRISSEMAMKCILSGIPLAVSRGAATSLALLIAERAGLSIVGFLRGEQLTIYTHQERLDLG